MAVARIRIPFDRWSVLISTAGYQTLRTYTVNAGQVLRLELAVTARQTDQTHRATFKRVGVFFRNGASSVEHQGKTWHTLETIKSDLNIDLRFLLSGNDVIIQGRNAGGVPTRWLGRVEKQSISS